jgi:hypothetical protein
MLNLKRLKAKFLLLKLKKCSNKKNSGVLLKRFWVLKTNNFLLLLRDILFSLNAIKVKKLIKKLIKLIGFTFNKKSLFCITTFFRIKLLFLVKSNQKKKKLNSCTIFFFTKMVKNK